GLTYIERAVFRWQILYIPLIIYKANLKKKKERILFHIETSYTQFKKYFSRCIVKIGFLRKGNKFDFFFIYRGG
ncbi:hypothetical protein CO057_00025, partial [Candidatus Uhrbacteria bacterium CG_4_9_14_0_2_um_filter_41_50]